MVVMKGLVKSMSRVLWRNHRAETFRYRLAYIMGLCITFMPMYAKICMHVSATRHCYKE